MKLKLPVSSLATREAGGALTGLAGIDRRLAERELARQRGVEIEAGSFMDGATIAQHAARREGGDLARERLRGGP